MNDQPPERGRLREAQVSPSRFTHLALSASFLIALLGLPLFAFAQSGVDGTSLLEDGMAQKWLWPAFGISIFLIGLNFVLSASETALGLLRNPHLKILEKSERQTQLLGRLMEDRSRAIAGCTLLRQMAFWGLVMVSLIPAVALLHESHGTVLNTFGTWLIVALPIAALNLILGELVPRTYAGLHPVGTCLRFGKIILLVSAVAYLPSRTLTWFASLVTKRFGAKASFAVVNQTEEEIKSLADTAEETGEMESDEKELLHSVFEFSDTVAREIMTPRVDMDAVPITSSVQEIIDVIHQSGHSRIPVYEDTDDQIVGIVHAKDLLNIHLPDDRPFNLRTILRPVFFVPENKNIHDLLSELRTSRGRIAIVQDEFGGTAGIVTTEDIVEELVGEIVDEYDVEQPDMVPDATGYVVNGKMNLDDLNSEIGTDFTSEEFDTVGGYVFGLFGRQPKPEEQIEDGTAVFCVKETDGRRILTLHVSLIGNDAESANQPTAAS